MGSATLSILAFTPFRPPLPALLSRGKIGKTLPGMSEARVWSREVFEDFGHLCLFTRGCVFVVGKVWHVPPDLVTGLEGIYVVRIKGLIRCQDERRRVVRNQPLS